MHQLKIWEANKRRRRKKNEENNKQTENFAIHFTRHGVHVYSLARSFACFETQPESMRDTLAYTSRLDNEVSRWIQGQVTRSRRVNEQYLRDAHNFKIIFLLRNMCMFAMRCWAQRTHTQAGIECELVVCFGRNRDEICGVEHDYRVVVVRTLMRFRVDESTMQTAETGTAMRGHTESHRERARREIGCKAIYESHEQWRCN